MLRRSTGEYPPEWNFGTIQAKAKNRAKHCCENCGVQFNEHNYYAVTEITSSGNPLKSSCHHIDHNRSNSDPNNIVFLCDRCHLDAHRHNWIPGEELPSAWRYNIPKWIVARNLPYTLSQMELWSDES